MIKWCSRGWFHFCQRCVSLGRRLRLLGRRRPSTARKHDDQRMDLLYPLPVICCCLLFAVFPRCRFLRSLLCRPCAVLLFQVRISDFCVFCVIHGTRSGIKIGGFGEDVQTANKDRPFFIVSSFHIIFEIRGSQKEQAQSKNKSIHFHSKERRKFA